MISRCAVSRSGKLICNLGAITAAALKAENFFDRIRVFERRETAGGTWSVVLILMMRVPQYGSLC